MAPDVPNRPTVDLALGRIRKRSVYIAGHATSVSLENAFWDALKDIAAARNVSLNQLIATVDRERGDAGAANLSSAIRVFVLGQFRNGR